MKYFGTKSVAELDEDTIAAERLMAIAGRFKTGPAAEAGGETPVDLQEAPKALDESN
jgi:hypothetical protein